MDHLPSLWALAPLFALLDWRFGQKGGNGTIKRLLVSVVVTGLVVAFTTNDAPNLIRPIYGAFLGLAFLCVRDPEWDIFGGDLDPTIHEVWGTVMRFLLALVFLIPLLFDNLLTMTMAEGAMATGALAAWAVFAALLGRLQHIAARNWGKDIEVAKSLVRGFSLGAVVALCDVLLS